LEIQKTQKVLLAIGLGLILFITARSLILMLPIKSAEQSASVVLMAKLNIQVVAT
jgi:hypothetical protein